MNNYSAPALTRVGGFREVTKSLGHSKHNDILGFRALIVIYP